MRRSKPADYRPLSTEACDRDQQLLILQHAADLRKFEIERFWTRSLVFWGFITTALLAFGAAKDHPELQLLAACYGELCALAWSLQNRGSKYWHESWEAKVEKVEREVLGTNLFSNKEPFKKRGWLSARRYSSSRLVIVLSDATTVLWAVLMVFACQPDLNAPVDWAKVALLSGMTLFALMLLVGARSR